MKKYILSAVFMAVGIAIGVISCFYIDDNIYDLQSINGRTTMYELRE